MSKKTTVLLDEFEVTRNRIANLETLIHLLESERIIGKADMKVLYDYAGNQLSRVFDTEDVFYEIHAATLETIRDYYQIPEGNHLRNLVIAQVNRDRQIAKLRNQRTKMMKDAFEKFNGLKDGRHKYEKQSKLPGM